MSEKHGKFCEFCNKQMKYNAEDTVCDVCDYQMERNQKLEADLRAQAWGKKFKCRNCGEGLTLNRAQHCEKCLPPDNIESDNEFDSVPAIDFDGSMERIRSAANRKKARDCNACGVNKPASAFYFQKPQGILRSMCKECYKTRRIVAVKAKESRANA